MQALSPLRLEQAAVAAVRHNLLMVLDSLRWTTFRSDGAQLTASNRQEQSLAVPSFKSSSVVKHWLPLRGWQCMPIGASFLWEAAASIYSMSQLRQEEMNKVQLNGGTVGGIIGRLRDGSQ